MEFLVYGRTRPGASEPSDELTEAHWAYLDRFSAGMIARGPTFSDDGSQWTGSLHVLELEDAEAARGFAREDPYHLAGVFATVEVRRWRNAAGRTMWEFATDSAKRRFLVLANDTEPILLGGDSEHVIVGGPLLSERDEPTGWAGLVEHDDRQAVETLTSAGAEIHRWEYGGRR